MVFDDLVVIPKGKPSASFNEKLLRLRFKSIVNFESCRHLEKFLQTQHGKA